MKILSTHPESQGPFVVIEDADFNPEIHEAYEEEPAGGPTREEMKAFLAEKGVPFANNIKSTALADLYNATMGDGNGQA